LSLPPCYDVEAAVVAAVEAHPTDGYRMATAWARRRLGRAVNRTRAAVEYEMKLRELPLQRLGRLEKISNAIVFLAAKRASFITSTVLGIDGGSIRATA
jgi:NAD(P)-dependent dehydrogenase (short-subunit alcohol dehydrogenase family)